MFRKWLDELVLYCIVAIAMAITMKDIMKDIARDLGGCSVTLGPVWRNQVDVGTRRLALSITWIAWGTRTIPATRGIRLDVASV